MTEFHPVLGVPLLSAVAKKQLAQRKEMDKNIFKN